MKGRIRRIVSIILAIAMVITSMQYTPATKVSAASEGFTAVKAEGFEGFAYKKIEGGTVAGLGNPEFLDGNTQNPIVQFAFADNGAATVTIDDAEQTVENGGLAVSNNTIVKINKSALAKAHSTVVISNNSGSTTYEFEVGNNGDDSGEQPGQLTYAISEISSGTIGGFEMNGPATWGFAWNTGNTPGTLTVKISKDAKTKTVVRALTSGGSIKSAVEGLGLPNGEYNVTFTAENGNQATAKITVSNSAATEFYADGENETDLTEYTQVNGGASTFGVWTTWIDGAEVYAKGGTQLDNTSIYLKNSTASKWNVQFRCHPTAVSGHRYRYNIVINSDKATTNDITLNDDTGSSGNGTNVFNRVLSVGENVFSDEFTAKANTLDLVFGLGNIGSEVKLDIAKFELVDLDAIEDNGSDDVVKPQGLKVYNFYALNKGYLVNFTPSTTADVDHYNLYIGRETTPFKQITESGKYIAASEIQSYMDGKYVDGNAHIVYLTAVTKTGVESKRAEGTARFTIQTNSDSDATDISRVYIVTNSGEALTRANKTDASVVIVGKDGDIIQSANDIGTVKLRGNSTSQADKKAYNIAFNNKFEVIKGAEKGKKWCLLANAYDKSLLRTKLAFDLGHVLGDVATPASQFVDVYLDGRLMGNYLLCEPADNGRAGIEYDDKNGKDVLIELEANDKDETGDGAAYYTPATGQRFVTEDISKAVEKLYSETCKTYGQMTNKLIETQEPQFMLMKKTLDDFQVAINNSATADDVLDMIDVDSFASMYIVNELFKTVDFGYSSVKFYITYDAGNNPTIHAGCLWDFDLSSGNSGAYAEGPDNRSVENFRGQTVNNWFGHLMQNEKFANKVKAKYVTIYPYIKSLYKESEEGENDSGIDNLISNFQTSITRNYAARDAQGAGWNVSTADPGENNYPYSYSTKNEKDAYGWITDKNFSQYVYTDHILYLKKWLEGRNDWISEQWLDESITLDPVTDVALYDFRQSGNGYQIIFKDSNGINVGNDTPYKVFINDTEVAQVAGSGEFISEEDFNKAGVEAGTNYTVSVQISVPVGESAVTSTKAQSTYLYKFTNKYTALANNVARVYVQTLRTNGNNNVNLYTSGIKTKINASIMVTDATGGSLSQDYGTIKLRGNSTAGAQKKPYNLKFETKLNVLGMGKAKKWSLLANAFDKTLMRNTMALSFQRDLETTYGPNQFTSKAKTVDFYLDGKYLGTYLLTESVEVGDTRVNINSKDEESNDILLELDAAGRDLGTDGHLTDDETTHTAKRLDNILGGDGYYFTINEPALDLLEDSADDQAKFWKKYYRKQKNAYDTLNEFQVLLKENADGTNNWDTLRTKINVSSFVNFYITTELFKIKDIAFSSTRFYIKDNVLYAGPLWDADLSSGNDESKTGEGSPNNLKAQTMKWFEYLMKYPQFKAMVVDRYKELLPKIKGLYEGENSVIDTEYNAISKSLIANNTQAWNIFDDNEAYADSMTGTGWKLSEILSNKNATLTMDNKYTPIGGVHGDTTVYNDNKAPVDDFKEWIHQRNLYLIGAFEIEADATEDAEQEAIEPESVVEWRDMNGVSTNGSKAAIPSNLYETFGNKGLFGFYNKSNCATWNLIDNNNPENTYTYMLNTNRWGFVPNKAPSTIILDGKKYTTPKNKANKLVVVNGDTVYVNEELMEAPAGQTVYHRISVVGNDAAPAEFIVRVVGPAMKNVDLTLSKDSHQIGAWEDAPAATGYKITATNVSDLDVAEGIEADKYTFTTYVANGTNDTFDFTAAGIVLNPDSVVTLSYTTNEAFDADRGETSSYRVFATGSVLDSIPAVTSVTAHGFRASGTGYMISFKNSTSILEGLGSTPSYKVYVSKTTGTGNNATESERAYVGTIENSGDHISLATMDAFMTEKGYEEGKYNIYVTKVLTYEGTAHESDYSEAGVLPYQNNDYTTKTSYGLPQVYIETDDNDAVLYTDASKVKKNSSIQILDKDGNLLVEDFGTANVRGNSTSTAQKKAYNIKFDSKKNVFGFGKEKKWSLLANAFDKSLIRNDIAYAFQRELEKDRDQFTSKTQEVDLFIDGEYMGTYLLCESVDVKESRVNIKAEDKTTDEVLIEINAEAKGENEEGMLEDNGKKTLAYYFTLNSPEKPGTNPALNDCKDATELAAKRAQFDADYGTKLNNVITLLHNAEAAMGITYDTPGVLGTIKYSNNTNIEEIGRYIDLESFVDFYITTELFRVEDIAYDSTRFYTKTVDGVTKLYAGPLWDADLSSGNNGSSTKPDADLHSTNMVWFRALMNNPDFKILVRDRYEELLPTIKNLFADNGAIEQKYQEIKLSAEANYSAAYNVYAQKTGAAVNPYSTNKTLNTGWNLNLIYASGHIAEGPDYGFNTVTGSKKIFDKDENGNPTTLEANYYAHVKYFKDWLRDRNTYLMEQFDVSDKTVLQDTIRKQVGDRLHNLAKNKDVEVYPGCAEGSIGAINDGVINAQKCALGKVGWGYLDESSAIIDLGAYYDASKIENILITYVKDDTTDTVKSRNYSISYSTNGIDYYTVVDNKKVDNFETLDDGDIKNATLDDVSSVSGAVRYVKVTYPVTANYGIQVTEIAVLDTNKDAVTVEWIDLDAPSIVATANDTIENKATVTITPAEGTPEGTTYNIYANDELVAEGQSAGEVEVVFENTGSRHKDITVKAVNNGFYSEASESAKISLYRVITFSEGTCYTNVDYNLALHKEASTPNRIDGNIKDLTDGMYGEKNFCELTHNLDGEYYQIDLGKIYKANSIDNVTVWYRQKDGNYNPLSTNCTGYTIQFSTDGENFVDVKSVTKADLADKKDTVMFSDDISTRLPSKGVRYVRVVYHGKIGYGAQASEIAVFNKAGDAQEFVYSPIEIKLEDKVEDENYNDVIVKWAPVSEATGYMIKYVPDTKPAAQIEDSVFGVYRIPVQQIADDEREIYVDKDTISYNFTENNIDLKAGTAVEVWYTTAADLDDAEYEYLTETDPVEAITETVAVDTSVRLKDATISVDVKNVGTALAVNVPVTIKDGDTVKAAGTISSISAGDTERINIVISEKTLGTKSYTVEVGEETRTITYDIVSDEIEAPNNLEWVQIGNSNYSYATTVFVANKDARGDGILIAFTAGISNASFEDDGSKVIIDGSGAIVPYEYITEDETVYTLKVTYNGSEQEVYLKKGIVKNFKPDNFTATMGVEPGRINVSWTPTEYAEAREATYNVYVNDINAPVDAVNNTALYNVGVDSYGVYTVKIETIVNGVVVDTATTTVEYKDPGAVTAVVNEKPMWEAKRWDSLTWQKPATRADGTEINVTGYAVYVNGKLVQALDGDALGYNVPAYTLAETSGNTNKFDQPTTVGTHEIKVVALVDGQTAAETMDGVNANSVMATFNPTLEVNYVYGNGTNLWIGDNPENSWNFTICEAEPKSANVKVDYQSDGLSILTIKDVGTMWTEGVKNAYQALTTPEQRIEFLKDNKEGDQEWTVKTAIYDGKTETNKDLNLSFDIIGPMSIVGQVISIKCVPEEYNTTNDSYYNVETTGYEEKFYVFKEYDSDGDGAADSAILNYSNTFPSKAESYDLLFGLGLLQFSETELARGAQLTFSDPTLVSTYGVTSVNPSGIYSESGNSMLIKFESSVPTHLESLYSYNAYIYDGETLVATYENIKSGFISTKTDSKGNTVNLELDKPYTVKVESLYGNTITAEATGTATIEKVEGDAKADYVISAVRSVKADGSNTDTVFRTGESAKINVTITNIGTKNSGNCNIRIIKADCKNNNPIAAGDIIYHADIAGGIESGSSKIISIDNKIPDEPGTYELFVQLNYFTLDAPDGSQGHWQEEYNYDNNAATTSIKAYPAIGELPLSNVDGKVVADWDDVTDATGYIVKYVSDSKQVTINAATQTEAILTKIPDEDTKVQLWAVELDGTTYQVSEATAHSNVVVDYVSVIANENNRFLVNDEIHSVVYLKNTGTAKAKEAKVEIKDGDVIVKTATAENIVPGNDTGVEFVFIEKKMGEYSHDVFLNEVDSTKNIEYIVQPDAMDYAPTNVSGTYDIETDKGTVTWKPSKDAVDAGEDVVYTVTIGGIAAQVTGNTATADLNSLGKGIYDAVLTTTVSGVVVDTQTVKIVKVDLTGDADLAAVDIDYKFRQQNPSGKHYIGDVIDIDYTVQNIGGKLVFEQEAEKFITSQMWYNGKQKFDTAHTYDGWIFYNNWESAKENGNSIIPAGEKHEFSNQLDTLDLAGLDNNNEYYLILTTNTAAGKEEEIHYTESNVENNEITEKIEVLPALTGVTLTNNGTNVIANWDAKENASSIEVAYYTQDGNLIRETLSGNATSYTFTRGYLGYKNTFEVTVHYENGTTELIGTTGKIELVADNIELDKDIYEAGDNINAKIFIKNMSTMTLNDRLDYYIMIDGVKNNDRSVASYEPNLDPFESFESTFTKKLANDASGYVAIGFEVFVDKIANTDKRAIYPYDNKSNNILEIDTYVTPNATLTVENIDETGDGYGDGTVIATWPESKDAQGNEMLTGYEIIYHTGAIYKLKDELSTSVTRKIIVNKNDYVLVGDKKKYNVSMGELIYDPATNQFTYTFDELLDNNSTVEVRASYIDNPTRDSDYKKYISDLAIADLIIMNVTDSEDGHIKTKIPFSLNIKIKNIGTAYIPAAPDLFPTYYGGWVITTLQGACLNKVSHQIDNKYVAECVGNDHDAVVFEGMIPGKEEDVSLNNALITKEGNYDLSIKVDDPGHVYSAATGYIVEGNENNNIYYHPVVVTHNQQKMDWKPLCYGGEAAAAADGKSIDDPYTFAVGGGEYKCQIEYKVLDTNIRDLNYEDIITGHNGYNGDHMAVRINGQYGIVDTNNSTHTSRTTFEYTQAYADYCNDYDANKNNESLKPNYKTLASMTYDIVDNNGNIIVPKGSTSPSIDFVGNGWNFHVISWGIGKYYTYKLTGADGTYVEVAFRVVGDGNGWIKALGSGNSDSTHVPVYYHDKTYQTYGTVYYDATDWGLSGCTVYNGNHMSVHIDSSTGASLNDPSTWRMSIAYASFENGQFVVPTDHITKNEETGELYIPEEFQNEEMLWTPENGGTVGWNSSTTALMMYPNVIANLPVHSNRVDEFGNPIEFDSQYYYLKIYYDLNNLDEYVAVPIKFVAYIPEIEEIHGLAVSGRGDTLSVQWNNTSSQDLHSYRYDVYIDGKKVADSVVAGLYSFKGYDVQTIGTEHTIKVVGRWGDHCQETSKIYTYKVEGIDSERDYITDEQFDVAGYVNDRWIPLNGESVLPIRVGGTVNDTIPAKISYYTDTEVNFDATGYNGYYVSLSGDTDIFTGPTSKLYVRDGNTFRFESRTIYDNMVESKVLMNAAELFSTYGEFDKNSSDAYDQKFYYTVRIYGNNGATFRDFYFKVEPSDGTTDIVKQTGLWRHISGEFNLPVTFEDLALDGEIFFYDYPSITNTYNMIGYNGYYMSISGNSNYYVGGRTKIEVSKPINPEDTPDYESHILKDNGEEDENRFLTDNYIEKARAGELYSVYKNSEYHADEDIYSTTAIYDSVYDGYMNIRAAAHFTVAYETNYYMVKISQVDEQGNVVMGYFKDGKVVPEGTDGATQEPLVTYVPMKIIVGSGDIDVQGFQVNYDKSPGSSSEFNPTYRVVSRCSKVMAVGEKLYRVRRHGTIYAVSERISPQHMTLNTQSEFIRHMETKDGLYNGYTSGRDDDQYYDYYAFSIRWITYNFTALTTGHSYRAYAIIEDEEGNENVVYGERVYSVTCYDVAKYLYDNCMMHTQEGHEFLYRDIVNLVEMDQNRQEIANSMLKTLNIRSTSAPEYLMINAIYKDISYYARCTNGYNYADRGDFTTKLSTSTPDNVLTLLNGADLEDTVLAKLQAVNDPILNNNCKTLSEWIEKNSSRIPYKNGVNFKGYHEKIDFDWNSNLFTDFDTE